MVDSGQHSGGGARPDAPRPLLADRYRMGQRKGRATDSAVHDAFDEQLQRAVVVRMIHPELSARPEIRQRFRGLMQTLAGLHHPHVASVFDWGAADWRGRQVLYVVTEKLDGGSLGDALDRGRKLTPSQALLVGLDTCKALDALHRAGIVHGDVRPSTIGFGDDRRLRLVDVGMTALLSEATGGVESLSNDVAKYVAPERAVGGPADAASDVYSLCLTLVESITGSVPFTGDSTVATLANRVDRLLPVSADFGALAAVLEKAGRPNPDERATAAEFGRGLVQAAPKLPKPTPLPILAAAAVGPDRSRSGDPVEPTGPIRRPRPSHDAPTSEITISTAPARIGDPSGPIRRSRPGAGPSTQALPVTRQMQTATQVITAVPIEEEDEPGWWSTSGGRRGLIIGIVVAALLVGGIGWFVTRPAQVAVPDVAGLEAAAALNLLADFEVQQVEVADDVVPVGSAVKTDPASGVAADEGSTVLLYVSIGPKPQVLPEVTGLEVAAATEQLEALGLVVQLGDPAYSEVVAEGQVVSWTVPGSPTLVAGDTVLKGTTVVLTVSGGKAPRAVPDLTGLTLAAAKARLDALGLVLEQGEDVFSTDIPAGSVVAQDPAVGTELAVGASVTVQLSKGPDLVAFPDLTDLDGETILKVLVQAEFKIGKVTGNGLLPLSYASIDGTLVNAGDEVPRGSVVDLFFETD
ncbi:MAG: PASTA domain-containing protein [Ilumatobacteraceae bacterium]